ncbi:hypothetical protein ACU4GD_45760 [Cupriavidus basilensis]
MNPNPLNELHASHPAFGKMLDDPIRDAARLIGTWVVLAACLTVSTAAGKGWSSSEAEAVRRIQLRAAPPLPAWSATARGWLLVTGRALRAGTGHVDQRAAPRASNYCRCWHHLPLFRLLYPARVLSGSGWLHGMLLLVEKGADDAGLGETALYVLGSLSDVVNSMESDRFFARREAEDQPGRCPECQPYGSCSRCWWP